MAAIDQIVARAQSAGKKLVLPEGQDPRVVAAANKIIENKVAVEVVVLGSEKEIAAACAAAGVTERKFKSLDYLNAPDYEEYANMLFERRKAKGMTIEKARETIKNRIYFGALMTKKGVVDGLVAGSIAETAVMLRAAFHCIGTQPGIKIASSCFVMDLAKPSPAGDKVLLFADCAVNPNPTAEQLVDIAAATAETYRSLFNKQPRVAFLSFSTHGSAQHELLDKVIEAKRLFGEKVAAEKLDVVFDGELQADAALVPGVAEAKAPGSPIGGAANVLIFPDLNVGNICYKITQRLAGAGAYGPVIQGLAQPLNDLSRGCSADDIYGAAAITVCQSMR